MIPEIKRTVRHPGYASVLGFVAQHLLIGSWPAFIPAVLAVAHFRGADCAGGQDAAERAARAMRSGCAFGGCRGFGRTSLGA